MRISDWSSDVCSSDLGETIDKVDPRNGQKSAVIPRSSAKDVDLAVAAAKSALPSWAKTTAAERTRLLLKLADIMQENTALLAREIGRASGRERGCQYV